MKKNFKKATLTTLSGAIIASNIPLNVFAELVIDEKNEQSVANEQELEVAENDEAESTEKVENEYELSVDNQEGVEESVIEEGAAAEEGEIFDVEKEEITIENEESEAVEEEIAVEDAVVAIQGNEEPTSKEEKNSQQSIDKTQVIVNIPDNKLLNVIRTALNKPTGDITQADMESLINLRGHDSGISDLTGLEYATNLQMLLLANCNVEDLTPLSGLTSLYHLNIANNKVKDLSPLKELSNMQKFYIQGNGISDISVLQKMPKIHTLWARNNKIEDINPIKELKQLTYLDLYSNEISDISVLSGLTNLSHLELEHNQISDISVLSGLTNLSHLDLGYNEISDISVLSGLTNLSHLALWHNEISDISALSKLTNLRELYLGFNPIESISVLSGLTKLNSLYLGHSQISDISVLSGLTNLEMLGLNNNQINDISALSGMTNLVYLDLEYNEISDISALSGMTNLESLSLSNNQVGNIPFLNGLTNLAELYLDNNQISDVSALSGLTNLYALYIHNNQIPDEQLEGLLNRLPYIYYLGISFDKEIDLSSLQNLAKLIISNSTISDFSALQISSYLGGLELIDCELENWDSIKAFTSLGQLILRGTEVPDYRIFEELPYLYYLELYDNNILDLSQFDELLKWKWAEFYDQHAKLDVALVDNKLENPFIDLDGSYITTIDLPNGVTLSDDGAYLIFDNPIVGNVYELTAKSYQTNEFYYYGEPLELKVTFTITESKKTGGELAVEENTLSNFNKELQIEIKDAAYEIEKIILPDGTEAQGSSASYIVSESGDYTIKYVDVQGNEFTQTITVRVDKPVIDKPSTDDSDVDKPTTSTNQAPIITASNVSIPVGYNLDLMSLAKATDKEDGDLDVKIISSNFDNTKPGVYNVTYQATDSKGLSTTKTIHIVVRDLSEDENPDTKDIVIAPNEELDIESIVNEIAKDKGLTDVEIIENNVNTSKPGDYSVVFEGTNTKKEQEIHSIKVTVMAEASSDKEDDHSSTSKPSGESVETGLTSATTITLGGLFTLAGIPFLKRKRK